MTYSTSAIVIATEIAADAVALLDSVSFDLVLTDSLTHSSASIEVESAGVREAAGSTPVVLFTAHQLERDTALAMGFRDLNWSASKTRSATYYS